ncbi:MAG: heme-binding protein [Pyrinomonadaceae bacterium]
MAQFGKDKPTPTENGITLEEAYQIIFGGGIPLQRGDKIVGAIGASGGTVPQDIEIAEAGVNAFNENH